MIMIAVQPLDIHAGLGHAPGQHAELAWNRLLEPLHDDGALLDHLDAGGLESAPRRGAVGEEEVRRALPSHHPRAAALDAHAGPPERFAHLGEGARTILQCDGQILHRADSAGTGSIRTSLFTDCEMKHCSCASWCSVSSSVAVGCLSPEKRIAGCSVTRVIARWPSAFL